MGRRWSRSPDITTPVPLRVARQPIGARRQTGGVRRRPGEVKGAVRAAVATRRPPTRPRVRPRAHDLPHCRKVREKSPVAVFNRANDANEGDATRQDAPRTTWRGYGPARRTRDRPVTNPFYTAGWVRSCLQDESGRTNRACDWPARTCNASDSRADCAVSCRLSGQSRASLPARGRWDVGARRGRGRFSDDADFPDPPLPFVTARSREPPAFKSASECAFHSFPSPGSPRIADHFLSRSCLSFLSVFRVSYFRSQRRDHRSHLSDRLSLSLSLSSFFCILFVEDTTKSLKSSDVTNNRAQLMRSCIE